MKASVWIPLAVLLGTALVAGAWWWTSTGETPEPTYTTTPVQRTTIEHTVSSTGSMRARETVEVGTQVSGTLDRVLVDYNDVVEPGQLLAVIDTSSLVTNVEDAEANLAQAEAKLAEAEATFARQQRLYEKDYVSEQAFFSSRTTLRSAEAAVQSAKATLRRARENLRHAEIRSPIHGVVTARNVDAGQTVSASLSAPTLFILAADLRRMQIEASVDESDIGAIEEGQPVRFTVAAYPDQTFEGAVRQVRLQPEVVSNVINYTVIIDVENESRRLLPGMTATVDFVVERTVDALGVSAAALQVDPTPGMRQAARADRPGDPSERPVRTKNARRNASPLSDSTMGSPTRRAAIQQAVASDSVNGNARRSDIRALWILKEDGTPEQRWVRTGVSNGFTTEVTPLRDSLKPGMTVISGVETAAPSSSASAGGRGQGRSPFGGGRGR